MSACDHDAFIAAQAELTKLRGQSLALIKPFLSGWWLRLMRH